MLESQLYQLVRGIGQWRFPATIGLGAIRDCVVRESRSTPGEDVLYIHYRNTPSHADRRWI